MVDAVGFFAQVVGSVDTGVSSKTYTSDTEETWVSLNTEEEETQTKEDMFMDLKTLKAEHPKTFKAKSCM